MTKESLMILYKLSINYYMYLNMIKNLFLKENIYISLDKCYECCQYDNYDNEKHWDDWHFTSMTSL